MKKLLCTILSLTLLLTGCTIGNGNIRIGAAGIGGMYYTFANTLAGLCTKEDTGFELEVKKTAGSAANLRLLSSNYISGHRRFYRQKMPKLQSSRKPVSGSMPNCCA